MDEHRRLCIKAQDAIDAAVAAITALPEDEWDGWLAYTLEEIEVTMGERRIFEMRDILLTRIESESIWRSL